jgi:D-arabinose 1-dehydrogenase-like Zn-dependent alcohol dehydrogenase
MKAAVMEVIGAPLKVHNNWPDPECGPSDAVIRVEANGICRSDYHIWRGGWEWLGLVPQPPTVLGHEYCGVVEEAGRDVTRFRKGDRVVAPFGHGCGMCGPCKSGHQNVCENLLAPMFHYTGGFGRYAKVARADVNLVLLPDSISFVEAASLGCRFATSWHGVVDQARVQAGEWVAVFGCGGIGLAAVEICTALGASVVAVSRSENKLAKARELGAVATVKADGSGVVAQVTQITKGGAHVSVDALGAKETCLNALYCLRARARHLRLGMSGREDGGHILLPVDLFVARELQFIGSFGMQASRYPEMLRMMESGKLQPGKLVTATLPIENASEVLESMGRYDTLGVNVINAW